MRALFLSGLMLLSQVGFAAPAPQAADPEADAARKTAEMYTSNDPAKIREAFLPTATLNYVKDGKMEVVPIDTYIERVAKSNANNTGAGMKKVVQSVERVGDEAIVRVVGSGPSLLVTDYLVMLKIEGTWKIVMKTFYVDRTASKAETK